MGELSKETLERIWHCRREIEAGNNLLQELEEERARIAETEHRRVSRMEPTLKDAFGRRRHLELGVPSGENSTRLFKVSPLLAVSIINSHIAKKTAELAEAHEQAKHELMEP
jgi:hypothetical protein